MPEGRKTFVFLNGIAEKIAGVKKKEKQECKSFIDQWIYNLKNMGPKQEVAFKSQNEIFKRLEKISNVASLTPEERYSYDADVKNARDTLNQMRYAFNQGEEKGKLDIARKMKQRGMDLGDIMLYTGLSEAQIAEL